MILSHPQTVELSLFSGRIVDTSCCTNRVKSELLTRLMYFLMFWFSFWSSVYFLPPSTPMILRAVRACSLPVLFCLVFPCVISVEFTSHLVHTKSSVADCLTCFSIPSLLPLCVYKLPVFSMSLSDYRYAHVSSLLCFFRGFQSLCAFGVKKITFQNICQLHSSVLCLHLAPLLSTARQLLTI